MMEPQYTPPEDVDQILRNAELRDELERYLDESISRVNVQHLPLAAENDFFGETGSVFQSLPVHGKLPIDRRAILGRFKL